MSKEAIELARRIQTAAGALHDHLENQARRDAVDQEPPPDIIDSGFRLSSKSIKRLKGVHPDIFAVTQYAIRVSAVDFGITRTGGVRSAELQASLTATGKSRAKHPRHVTGHAVDFYPYVDGKANFAPVYAIQIHDAFTEASEALDVPLRWGGDWDMDGDIRERGENDLVHHELPRKVYGNNKHSQSMKAAAYLAGINREATL